MRKAGKENEVAEGRKRRDKVGSIDEGTDFGIIRERKATPTD